MEVVKLPIGVSAHAEDDCIHIQQCSDGEFMLTGTLLAGEDNETESVGLVESVAYPTYEEAEAAGLAWANECGVSLLYVSRSDGTQPMPDPR